MSYLKLLLEILGHMLGEKIQKKENLPYGRLTFIGNEQRWLQKFNQCSGGWWMLCATYV